MTCILPFLPYSVGWKQVIGLVHTQGNNEKTWISGGGDHGSHLRVGSFLTWLVLVRVCYKYTCISVCEDTFSFFLVNKMSGIAGPYGKYVWFSNRLPRCFAVVLFSFPPAVFEYSSCPTSIPTLGIVHLFNFSHSSECVVVFHCCLICISVITNGGRHLFMSLLLKAEGSFFTPHVNISCPNIICWIDYPFSIELSCHFC